jgi:hypothetical protein
MKPKLERDHTPPRGWRKLVAIVKGRYMPPRMLRVMLWFGMAWTIAVVGLALGVWGSLSGEHLADSMRAFSVLALVGRKPNLTVDVETVVFWLLLFIWTLLVAFRLLAESLDREEQFEETYVAVTRTPNPQLIDTYPTRFADLAKRIDAALDNETAERGSEIQSTIHGALVEITTMLHQFARPDVGASYGANVMLVANRPFDQKYIDTLIYFDKEKYEPTKLSEVIDGSLRHILYMPPALIIRNASTEQIKDITEIALPVPSVQDEPLIERYALPGAPFALLSGQGSVYVDTHDLAQQHCSHFDAYIRKEIDAYFKDGAGRGVRSFASWRIGTDRDPIGVLNIDSNKPYILGRNADFYPQFLALMAPLLRLIAEPVAEYAVWLASKPQPAPQPAVAPAPVANQGH